MRDECKLEPAFILLRYAEDVNIKIGHTATQATAPQFVDLGKKLSKFSTHIVLGD